MFKNSKQAIKFSLSFEKKKYISGLRKVDFTNSVFTFDFI
jgi:hypothetical protein